MGVTIMMDVTKADVERVWGKLPVISVGQKIEGIPSVLIETEDSMKQLVEHLILTHNYRNFLFISGAEDHPDAEVREQIFIKTMEAYRPWFADLKYVLKRGYFTEVAAIRAMSEYMEEKNEAPDVVVCAIDSHASLALSQASVSLVPSFSNLKIPTLTARFSLLSFFICEKSTFSLDSI